MTTLPILWRWLAIGKSPAGSVRYRTRTPKRMGASGSPAQENHAAGCPRRFAVALKETDRLIGGVGLDGTTGDGSDEPALGYWLGQPYWGNGYAHEAAAAIIDYGFRTLGLETIRAYTDPGNAASQKVLLHCGLKNVGEIELLKPTHHGERRAPLFRILRPEL